MRSLLQSIDRVEAAWTGVESDLFLPVGVAAGKCGREVAESEAIERVTAGWEDAVRRACGKIPPKGWEEEIARMKGEIEACNAVVQDLTVANDRAHESLQAALQVNTPLTNRDRSSQTCHADASFSGWRENDSLGNGVPVPEASYLLCQLCSESDPPLLRVHRRHAGRRRRGKEGTRRWKRKRRPERRRHHRGERGNYS